MSDSFLNEMDLEIRIKEMADRELLEFSARSIYFVRLEVIDHHKRIKRLENRNRKEIGATGGIGAIIGVAIASVVDFFLRRQG